MLTLRVKIKGDPCTLIIKADREGFKIHSFRDDSNFFYPFLIRAIDFDTGVNLIKKLKEVVEWSRSAQVNRRDLEADFIWTAHVSKDGSFFQISCLIKKPAWINFSVIDNPEEEGLKTLWEHNFSVEEILGLIEALEDYFFC